MQTQRKYAERRQTERRVSPAVGDFALEERGKLLAENERLRTVLSSAQNLRPMLLGLNGYVPECVLDFCNRARAALKVAP